MPKKSINQNDVVITTKQGQDSINESSNNNTLNVSAENVSSSNALGGFLGENVQSHLDNLSSVAEQLKPPSIGKNPITFKNKMGIETTHDGRIDWGNAKITDSAPWLKKSKKWAEKKEMPHYLVGQRQNEIFLAQNKGIKYINEDGIYDNVSVNFRDKEETSYFGYDSITNGDDTQFEYAANFAFDGISFPRKSFLNIEEESIFPFFYQKPFIKEEDQNDLFNSSTGLTLGFSTGEGTASLGIKSGEPTICISPLSTQRHDPVLNTAISQVGSDVLTDVGICLSGLLFPADRGTVALIKFSSNADGVSSSFVGTPATSTSDILNRVVAAINLGHGVGRLDGEPGGAMFNNSFSDTFPSRKTGQYDLYELHVGQYLPTSENSGQANPNITADKTIGQVRLLSEPLAFNIDTPTITGGLPVLFSPYVWDTAGGTQTLKENRNFLSYRMPVLSDYSPEGLITDSTERERFFLKNVPNKDQYEKSYSPNFNTAGNYITFGEADNYSFQVARYRHAVNITDHYYNLSRDNSTPEHNMGSFALIHFKTESAFERLVRDGIAPSNDEVYSQNLIDYSDLKNNVGKSLGLKGGDGITDSSESFEAQDSMSVFRPNVSFEKKMVDDPSSFTITREVQSYGFHSSDTTNTINRKDSYFMFMSGAIYLSPNTFRTYKGHPPTRGGQVPFTNLSSFDHSYLYHRINISSKVAQGNDLFGRWDYTTPDSGDNVNFNSVSVIQSFR